MARLSILARDRVFKKIFFIYFWLHWVLIAVRGLSLVVASRGYSLIALPGLLLLRSTCSRVRQFQWLWHTGLVTSQHVESSRTRDRTHVADTDRWVLNHWTTREVQGAASELRGGNTPYDLVVLEQMGEGNRERIFLTSATSPGWDGWGCKLQISLAKSPS